MDPERQLLPSRPWLLAAPLDLVGLGHPVPLWLQYCLLLLLLHPLLSLLLLLSLLTLLSYLLIRLLR
jgi:hypothetical protein